MACDHPFTDEYASSKILFVSKPMGVQDTNEVSYL